MADLHAAATALAAYYTAFGVGAFLGALLTPYLRRVSLWPVTIAIVVGLGLALVPLGVGAPVGLALVSFAVAGLIWAPYPAISMALFQRSASIAALPSVLAANGAVAVVSVPLGTLLGAPLVGSFGARTTILLCGLAMVAMGLVAACLAARRRARGSADAGDIDETGNGA